VRVWCLQLAGLLVGFVGALLVTVSQRSGKNAFEGRAAGEEVAYVVLEYPRLWTSGLWLLSAGFVLQLISLNLTRPGK
jgi:hypothetical protein